ncbi:hypothetical protein M0R45_020594 [Rubus argutus]|uniref:Uncharacterized protein n=1 Tax=Rubus argutus TaxID=59490 RepID=A0AAW1XB07_RUBAR
MVPGTGSINPLNLQIQITSLCSSPPQFDHSIALNTHGTYSPPSFQAPPANPACAAKYSWHPSLGTHITPAAQAAHSTISLFHLQFMKPWQLSSSSAPLQITLTITLLIITTTGLPLASAVEPRNRRHKCSAPRTLSTPPQITVNYTNHAKLTAESPRPIVCNREQRREQKNAKVLCQREQRRAGEKKRK